MYGHTLCIIWGWYLITGQKITTKMVGGAISTVMGLTLLIAGGVMKSHPMMASSCMGGVFELGYGISMDSISRITFGGVVIILTAWSSLMKY